MAKTCANCGQTHIKEDKYFYKDKSRKDGLAVYCIACVKEFTAFYEERGKPPKTLKTCEYSKCNNTFETRMERKKFCCGSCNSKAYQERKGLEDVRFRQNFLKKLRRKKENIPKKRKNWSFDEIEILMDGRKENIPFKEIGKKVGRTSDACMKKHYDILKSRGLI